MGRSCYARVAQATAAPGRMYSSFGAGASAGTSGMLALTRWEQRARACAARRPEYRGCIDGRSVHPVRVRSDHASAEYWRAAQERVLTMPVLAIGGAESWGEAAGHGMEPAADDVRSLLGDPVAGAGDNHGLHEMLAALTVPRPAPRRIRRGTRPGAARCRRVAPLSRPSVGTLSPRRGPGYGEATSIVSPQGQ